MATILLVAGPILATATVLRTLNGERTEVNLRMSNYGSDDWPENMSLTYWTSLEEPRSCVREIFQCEPSKF